MNLSSAIPSVYGQENLNAPASAMYGDRAKKSGVGHYSLLESSNARIDFERTFFITR